MIFTQNLRIYKKIANSSCNEEVIGFSVMFSSWAIINRRYRFLKNSINNSTINEKHIDIRIIIIFLFSSCLFTIIYSFSTSPLYSSYGSDSAIFQTIGRYWTESGNQSMIPYLNLFDHKGPLIFLIDAIGYGLTGNKYGILCIQIITIFIVCIGIYKICRIELSKNYAIFWTIVNLFFLASCYEDGNLTEEYALPFIVFSLYCIYKYFGSYSADYFTEWLVREHPPMYAFIYGITVAFCFMTRVTNALVVCIGVLMITITIMLKRKWINLLHNMIGFLCGMIIIIVPFVIYFALHGALYDFWFGTIVYNMQYASSSGWIWKQDVSILKLMAYVAFILFTCLPITILGIIAVYKKMYEKGIFLFMIGVSSILYLLINNTYRHYSIIMIPYFILSICEIKRLNSIIIRKYMFILFLGLALCSGIASTGVLLINGVSEKNQGYKELMAYIPSEEIESTIGYNVPSNMYLEYNIVPHYPYFQLQDWQGKKSTELMNKIRKTFIEGDVKWIIVMGESVGIQDILDTNYTCTKRYSDRGVIYKLYCRN